MHKFLRKKDSVISGWWLESIALSMIPSPSPFSHQSAGEQGIVGCMFAFGDTIACTSHVWWHQHFSWPDDRRGRPATPPSSHQPVEQPPSRRWSAESPDAPSPSWLPLWTQNERSRKSWSMVSMAGGVSVGCADQHQAESELWHAVWRYRRPTRLVLRGGGGGAETMAHWRAVSARKSSKLARVTVSHETSWCTRPTSPETAKVTLQRLPRYR